MACNVFYIFFEFSSSNGGSTKAMPISSCRQPVFGINSPRLLICVPFHPHTCCLYCHSRDCISYYVFRTHVLEVFGHC